jgi:transcriptional regulator of PTS gene
MENKLFLRKEKLIDFFRGNNLFYFLNYINHPLPAPHINMLRQRHATVRRAGAIMIREEAGTSLTVRKFQRAMHRSAILDLIRTTGLISRTDLARKTRLSQASVTGITADLIDEGLIEEKETGTSEGGRKPILLAIRADGVFVIGINLSIEQIRVVIINFQAELKASHIVRLTESFYQPGEIVEIIALAIQECMWQANYSREQIAGVGVGIPGPVDSSAGIIRFLPNYGWSEVGFRDMLRDRINHPVFIDNSANNLAIAEHWYGNGKGIGNFVVVTVENGIGAGAIINGQLVRGHQGIACEFGHVCANPQGPLCRCGRPGCIEAYAGNNAIIRRARKLAGRGAWHSSGKKPEDIVFADVIAELEHGNNGLEAVYREAGEVLGIGIYNLVTLFNPELVIITGKGVLAGKALTEPMSAVIDRLRKGRFGSDQTRILVQPLTDGDWAIQSGTLVLREIYKSPTIV